MVSSRCAACARMSHLICWPAALAGSVVLSRSTGRLTESRCVIRRARSTWQRAPPFLIRPLPPVHGSAFAGGPRIWSGPGVSFSPMIPMFPLVAGIPQAPGRRLAVAAAHLALDFKHTVQTRQIAMDGDSGAWKGRGGKCFHRLTLPCADLHQQRSALEITRSRRQEFLDNLQSAGTAIQG